MLSANTLVGRDGELDALRRTLDAGGREGACVLVCGEPGIGKTTLLTAARTEAHGRGALVLSTVGVEAEARLPFAGLLQLLSPLMERADDLVDAHQQALLTAFGMAEGPQPSLFLIAEATLALLELSGQQVVVVADDVQWLDSPTDEIINYLGRRAPTAGLTVIGAARLGHASLFIDAGFDRLEIGGIAEDACNEILDQVGAGLSSRDRFGILAEAQGNPLALLELPRVWEAGSADDHPPLTSRLERAFASRIGELPPATRDILLVAAVNSSDSLEEILDAAAALGKAAQRGTYALAAAIDAGLVVVDDGRIRFRHPLMRSGVLRSESVLRRQDANRAVADILTEQPFRQTWHLAQSIVGPDDTIADRLEDTVGESLRRGAVMSAVASLERAAELSSSSRVRGHRLLIAAEHAFGSGRADVVDRLVAEAVRTDLSELDWARMHWLREIFDDGLPGDATRVLELCDVARRSATAGDVDLALNLLMGAALRCWWADTGPGARADVVATVRGLTVTRDDPRHVAAIAVADPVEHGALAASMLAATDLASVEDANALRLYGMAAHAIGDTVLATDVLDRSEVVLRAQALAGLLPHVLGMQVHIRHEIGDWAGAREAMREVHRLAAETGQPIWSLNNRILVAQADALHGRWRQALEGLAATEIEVDRRGLNDTLCLARLAQGTALLAAGRPAEAYDQLRASFDPGDPSYHQRENFSSLGFLAEAAAEAGRTQDAATLLPELERLATLTPSPILRVHLSYAQLVLAADPEDAQRHFLEGLDACHDRWPWPRARLLAAYGGSLRRQGRSAEATPLLRESLATFEAIGAKPWADRARRELDARS